MIINKNNLINTETKAKIVKYLKQGNRSAKIKRNIILLSGLTKAYIKSKILIYSGVPLDVFDFSQKTLKMSEQCYDPLIKNWVKNISKSFKRR